MVERALFVAMTIVAVPTAAQGDRYEASIAADLRGGAARIGERGTIAETVPALVLGARLTHAWSNGLAWDARVDGVVTDAATFPDAEAVIDGRGVRGAVTRRTVAAGAQVGAELRHGAQWIPLVRLGVGPQLRYRSGSDLGAVADAIPPSVSLDVGFSFGLGLDVRLGRHRVVGIVVQLDHAQPLGDAPSLDLVTVGVRVSSYWYPRWWAPAW